MPGRTFEDIKKYVEWQSQNKCKVVSAKPEHTFNDLGTEVRVWNVKTDVEGFWWVVEGDVVAMNLYPQDAYYFGADEVYSFHMGIMQRMQASSYKPEDYVSALSLDSDIAPRLFRKLKGIADLVDTAVEIEDFQSIGVQCRELLIELGNSIYSPDMATDNEQPQASNFKKKAELFVQFYLTGSENGDYRTILKKLTESTWDCASKITHSRSATFYEASTCVSLCISLVSAYENIRQKVFDPLSQYHCNNCLSKKLEIIDDESNEEGIVKTLYLKCEECDEITAIEFKHIENESQHYTRGVQKID